MTCRAAAYIALLSIAVPTCGRHTVGTMCGQKVFFLEDETRVDTVGWNDVEREQFGPEWPGRNNPDSLGRSGPSQATAAFEAHGKRLYRLRDLSAVAAAILHELNLQVVTLSQWVSQPNTYMSLSGPSSRGDSYQRRRIVSDYLWERLDGARTERPVKLSDDPQITLQFARGNYSTMPGKQMLCERAVQLVAPGEAARLEFTDESGYEVFFKRRIHRTYLIAPAELSVKQIISRIESAMDKRKLDLSYRAPRIERLE